MAGRHRKKKLLALVATLVAIVALWRYGSRGPAAPGGARTDLAHGDGAARPGAARWIPWLGRGDPARPATKRDPYQGPRVPVRVRVVDTHGSPVRGVLVEARVDPAEWEYAGLTPEEYAAYADEVAPEEVEDDGGIGGDDWRVVRSAVDSGRTDRNGVWVGRLKPDVDVIFHASDGAGREGISPLLYVYLADGADGDIGDPYLKDGSFEVTIELAELGLLTGLVVDDRGRPVPGAEVLVSPWNGDLEQEELVAGGDDRKRTGDDGSFRISLRASGAFDVEVHAKSFQPSTEQAVQVLPGRETRLNITLLPSAEIAGVVLDPRGAPFSRARVVVQGQPSPGTYLSTETMTGDDGRFTVEELAPGSYVVAAMAEGLRPAERWGVQAGGPEVTLSLTAGGAVHGEVTVSRELLEPPRAAAAKSPGSPELELEPARLSFGDVYLSLSGGPADPSQPIPPGVPLATGVPTGKEVESPSGTLDVRGRYFAQVSFDGDGRGTFDVRGLPTGAYDVTVMVGAAVVRRAGVRVWEGGTASLSMSLPDRGAASVAGVVRTSDGRPLQEATVFLYGTLPAGLSAYSDGSGRFEFRSVPAGEYMVHAAATVAARADAKALITAYVPSTVVHVPSGGRVPLDLVAVPSDVPSGGFVEELTAVALDGELPAPIDVDPLVEDGFSEAEPEDLWMPDVSIEDVGGVLVVIRAPPSHGARRLFGGDRVVTIDGAMTSAMETWEALDLLYGPRGSLCRITVERPASRETISVSLPRDKNAYEVDGHEYDR